MRIFSDVLSKARLSLTLNLPIFRPRPRPAPIVPPQRSPSMKYRKKPVVIDAWP